MGLTIALSVGYKPATAFSDDKWINSCADGSIGSGVLPLDAGAPMTVDCFA